MFDGTLTGTITQAASQNPDTGHAYKLSATGTLTGMGAFTASGTAHGTGFIAQGHETLHLTLQGSSGSMTFQMHSPPVKGFTSP